MAFLQSATAPSARALAAIAAVTDTPNTLANQDAHREADGDATAGEEHYESVALSDLFSDV